ncbi:MAG: FMN-dependent NADH-azoreductase [Gammaproteobacteria bacterium]|nr:FMN-dependent NADH-azoreductase [Gammaproteobacteria bacterium]
MTSNILRLDASANVSGSSSRKLGDQLIAKLSRRSEVNIQYRDLNQGLNFIDETWVGAYFTPPEQRSEAQTKTLEFSDKLIDELRRADHIVLTTPMYNFSIPASLKAWIDLICRAGVTFQYTADGPVGLLRKKHIDIIITTGGVPLQSPVDFLSDYLKQVFRFIGIEQINIIAADQMNVDAEVSFNKALDQINTRIAA